MRSGSSVDAPQGLTAQSCLWSWCNESMKAKRMRLRCERSEDNGDGEEVMELRAKGPDSGQTREARRQDKADRGSLGQRCSSAQTFYLCFSFFFFFFLFWWRGRGQVGRETEKQNQRGKTPMTSLPATPGPRPEPMRVRMSTHTAGDSNNLGDWGKHKSVILDSTVEEAACLEI